MLDSSLERQLSVPVTAMHVLRTKLHLFPISINLTYSSGTLLDCRICIRVVKRVMVDRDRDMTAVVFSAWIY